MDDRRDRRGRAAALAVALTLLALGSSRAAVYGTAQVSVSAVGAQAGNSFSEDPAVSANGRFVAFRSVATDLAPGDTNDRSDIFVRDRLLAITERVSVTSNNAQAAGGDCYGPAISADGRFVVFVSYAPNLAPGDTNGNPDIFVRDRLLGTTERINVASNGAQATGGGSATAQRSARTDVLWRSNPTRRTWCRPIPMVVGTSSCGTACWRARSG